MTTGGYKTPGGRDCEYKTCLMLLEPQQLQSLCIQLPTRLQHHVPHCLLSKNYPSTLTVTYKVIICTGRTRAKRGRSRSLIYFPELTQESDNSLPGQEIRWPAGQEDQQHPGPEGQMSEEPVRQGMGWRSELNFTIASEELITNKELVKLVDCLVPLCLEAVTA